jgi:hypothetical protein
VYPQPLLNIINPAVRQTLSQVHVTNPVPPHPSTTTDGLLITPRGGAARFDVTGLVAAQQKGTAP